MPPSAAPEWLRVGCSLEITATFARASYASMAARMPAQPAPTTRTSCVASTWTDATETPRRDAALGRFRFEDPQRPVGALDALRLCVLGEARAQQPDPCAIPLEERPHHGQDRRDERPRSGLPMHRLRRLREVGGPGVGVEEAFVFAAL